MKKSFSSHIFWWPSLVFLMILAMAGMAARVSPEKASAAPNSTLYFDPATYTIGTNQDFSLDAKINPGNNQVTAVELHVTFDQTKFRLDSISTDPAPGAPFPVILQPAAINNANGTASITVGIAAANPLVPVETVSKIATLAFHSLAAINNSSISFANASLAAAVGEAGDVLTTRTPAAITVTAVTYNSADFAALVTNWLQSGITPSGKSTGEISGDGIVNSKDLGIMMSNWQ